jgi:hypothetical protein
VTSGNFSPFYFLSIVIPANAGIQLPFAHHVMAGLDPAISSRAGREITGSNPVMTKIGDPAQFAS